MKKINLYLETSVFGFYYDMDQRNIYKKEATVILFNQIKKGFFNAFAGDTTIIELNSTTNILKREQLLKMLKDFMIKPLHIAKEKITEISYLSDMLIKKKVIPRKKRDDALHLATMIAYPELDVLVSWNCKHIVNLNIKREAEKIAINEGYRMKFEILTPEEVIKYEK